MASYLNEYAKTGLTALEQANSAPTLNTVETAVCLFMSYNRLR
jgi:hypothetical protein